MPLSEPAAREDAHRRQIECRGYKRLDGLWDIEGHLVDTKPYGFDNRERGRVEPGVPVHDMWIRLTIDTDMCIVAAQASTEHSPYAICGAVTRNFHELVGLRIGPGWSRRAARKIGGVKGCTHLTELLRPMATTAYQTLTREDAEPPDLVTEQPRYLNGCHALATDGVIVKLEWPQFYKAT